MPCCVTLSLALARFEFELGHFKTPLNPQEEAKERFRSAERREQALPRSVHAGIDWGQKMLAQVWAVRNSAATGAHRECRGCGKPTEQLKLCSRCQMAAYCSPECQRAHWPIHKRECRKLELEERQALREGRPRQA